MSYGVLMTSNACKGRLVLFAKNISRIKTEELNLRDLSDRSASIPGILRLASLIS